MKFFTEGRLEFLDGHVGPESQSVLREAIIWGIFYVIYSNIFSRVLRNLYRKSSIWTTAHKRIGVFCANGRDDSVLVTVLLVHHLIASIFMYVGISRNDHTLWRHGYLYETGFEIADLISLTLSLYPYRCDGIKPEVKAAFVFHHLPGILLAPFVMSSGLYANPHLQAIALWLLAGGAVSCFTSMYIYTLDFETQMKQAAAAYLFGTGFFFWARAWVFPIESLAVLEDIEADETLRGTFFHQLLRFGGVSLSLFNVGILADVLPKSVRYVRRAFDGVTPIETEPIPQSRDSILGRRRSSIMQAAKQVSSSKNSFATVLLLNPIEDIVHSNKETVAVTSMHGISEEDQAALNRTLSALSEKSSKKDI
jgi:hypothetical protein